MSRVKPSKLEIMLNYKLWLSNLTGDGVIEEDTYRLLKEIDHEGSISGAAKKTGTSYRKAWGDLKDAERLLGYPLTVRKRGGAKGGATTLTDKARKLLQAYDALQVKMDDAVEKAYEEFKRKIRK